jgi:hypothetical protein
VSKEWNGTLFRVNVCREISPKLFEDLYNTTPRYRAQRLRLLAALGLAFEQAQGIQVNQQLSEGFANVTDGAKGRSSEKVTRVLTSFSSQLDSFGQS